MAVSANRTDHNTIDHHCPVKRATTDESLLCPRTKAHPASLLQTHSQRSHSYSSSLSSMDTDKRRSNLQLPSFASLGIGNDTSRLERASSQPNNLRTTMAPLLTPPPDDSSISYFNSTVSESPFHTRTTDSSRSQQQTVSQGQGRESPARSQLALDLSQSCTMPDQPSFRHHTWVVKSAQVIVKSLNAVSPTDSLQVVSQMLPSQAKDSRTKPIFEDVLEQVQLGLNYDPFITITHAVPQARTMEELPKTPPSTPRPTRSAHDYFADDQTIFTHAAVVPIYHNHGPVTRTPVRIPHNISAPNVRISILERYIPPTMPEEITDFFSSASKRSYLSDRLSELSPSNGSLLLIYPTRSGGETFAREYIGPILDPFLRQFILLNNLTSDAASAMGTMTAVEAMLDYEDMGSRLEHICQALTDGPPLRGQRSRFTMSHSEKTTATLDRSTWVNWYVEQEQSRLRQNLVEYHQSGGRMPGARDNKEVTLGMLTREVIEGIQKSRESAGGAGIEVGVFVITRSSLA